MPNAFQIRSRLTEWINGGISLSEFEDWFVPETWNIHKANDPEAEALTDEIELSLSEYSGGYLSLDRLKENLKELAHIATPSARPTDYCVRYALEGSYGKAQPLNRDSIEDFGFSKVVLKCVPGVSPLAGRSSSLDVRFGEAA
jgi:hypothetical protein